MKTVPFPVEQVPIFLLEDSADATELFDRARGQVGAMRGIGAALAAVPVVAAKFTGFVEQIGKLLSG